MTPSGDHVADLDAEHLEEKVNLIVARAIKLNLQKWVVKKRKSQVSELDHLKLKTVVLHDDHDDEIHMTQPIEFITTNLISVDGWAFRSRLDKLRVTWSFGQGVRRQP